MATFTGLKRAVFRLVAAEIADSWKGGGDPDDIPDIEKELTTARAIYQRTVDELERESENTRGGLPASSRGP